MLQGLRLPATRGYTNGSRNRNGPVEAMYTEQCRFFEGYLEIAMPSLNLGAASGPDSAVIHEILQQERQASSDRAAALHFSRNGRLPHPPARQPPRAVLVNEQRVSKYAFIIKTGCIEADT